MLSYLQQRRFLAEQCVDRKGFVSVSPTVRPCRSEAYKRACRRNFKCLSIYRVVCLFTTITIKPLSGNCLFSIADLYRRKRGRKIEEYKQQYLPHFYSDLGIGWSSEIRITISNTGLHQAIPYFGLFEVYCRFQEECKQTQYQVLFIFLRETAVHFLCQQRKQ